MRKPWFLLLCLALPHLSASAQSNFFQQWEARTTRMQSMQPSWSTPVVAPYPMLVQAFRFDVSRQITPALTPTWSYESNRGLNLVPGFNSQVDIYPPSYVQHNTANTRDGFGDFGFLYKYRLLSANEKHGNYLLSAQAVVIIPTGTYTNGSRAGSISPTLIGGKGFGKFDLITSLGGTLPTSQTLALGRSIAWNTTAQYHVGKYLWPELEDNATFYSGGKNDGKMQNFLTPGITLGKFKLHPRNTTSRLGLSLGAGMQIATSGFHTYNHNLVITSRFLF